MTSTSTPTTAPTAPSVPSTDPGTDAPLHVVVGAGPIGSATARHLVRLGRRVRLLSRSGSGEPAERIEVVAADATDVDRLAELAADAEAIHNCANPPYHRWATDWPPLATSMLAAAERTGAKLVTASNLYGYAAGSSPMAASDPLEPPTAKGAIRVQMWRDALAAHRDGRVRVAEVRASDFVGVGVGDNAHLGDRFVAAVLRGRTPRVIGATDVEHSWTYVDDVGRMMAIAATDDRALGQAWHVPTAPPLSAQEMADAFADVAGVEPVTVRRVPGAVLRGLGLVSRTMRELPEMLYQFDEPFVIDAARTTAVFGMTSTPFVEQLRTIVTAVGGTREPHLESAPPLVA